LQSRTGCPIVHIPDVVIDSAMGKVGRPIVVDKSNMTKEQRREYERLRKKLQRESRKNASEKMSTKSIEGTEEKLVDISVEVVTETCPNNSMRLESISGHIESISTKQCYNIKEVSSPQRTTPRHLFDQLKKYRKIMGE